MRRFSFQSIQPITMKYQFLLTLGLALILFSCAKRIEYTPEIIEQTSGRYLLTPDEVIEVFYDNNELFLKWRGAERLKPVVLDNNSFFVPDMYKKFHFVQHPQTGQRYLSVINKDDDTKISYDYKKLKPGYKTPSMHLKDHEFEAALEGFMAIKTQDSTSILIDEREFNSLGYEYLRKKKFDLAIEVFKINVALYPESENVYDSLADGYLRTGDSLNAFVFYSKALELNSGNPRAKRYIKAYNDQQKSN